MRREVSTAVKVRLLMRRLGEAAQGPGRIYLVGGASAVLVGWRSATVDVDIKLAPEPPGVFQAIAHLKEALNMNVELAAPDDFIPPLPDWRERSRSIAQHGPVEFFHYDFYAQALAKIERGHEQDWGDVRAMHEYALIEPQRLGALFDAIKTSVPRYPAIDVACFAGRVDVATKCDGRWPMAVTAHAHPVAIADLPGADFVQSGLDALRAVARGERETFTPEALLVAIGARRLRAAGLEVPHAPGCPQQPELALYEAIAAAHADAHSRYNALIRRLVSFERALEARHRRLGEAPSAGRPT